MKIKLVTFAPHPNFGTCLQGYALNFVLKEMGHDVEFIYNRRENKPASNKKYCFIALKRILSAILPDFLITKLKRERKEVNGHSLNPIPNILTLPNRPVLKFFSKCPFYTCIAKWWYYPNLQSRKVYKFTFKDGNFKMRRLFTATDYEDVEKDADLLVTGSDQIWNAFCGGYNPMMFLEFVKHKKCIAYSSSIAQQKIHPSVELRMKKALSKFAHIGVREQDSVGLLNTLLHRTDVKLVLDPTFLLSVKEWETFGEKAQIEFELPKKYIFCYFVGHKRREEYEVLVNEVKRFTGINDVISLECYNRKYVYGGGRLYLDGGPYEWVYLLRHASYVCLDSFHATVFSLKFNKEFVHIMKDVDQETGSQNTRMYDILNRYDLIYKNYTGKNANHWQKTIDYACVNRQLEKDIMESYNFLKFEIEE